MKKERIPAEVAEGIQSNFIHGIDPADKFVNNAVNQQDMLRSAAVLAHKESIPFAEARQIVSGYYSK